VPFYPNFSIFAEKRSSCAVQDCAVFEVLASWQNAAKQRCRMHMVSAGNYIRENK